MAQNIVETIEIPAGVQAELDRNSLKVKGNGKENSREFKAGNIFLRIDGQKIEVVATSSRRNVLAQASTSASHIRNLITGLEKTFECRLEIVYSHFPINAAVKGSFVEINNLAGAKHPKKARIIGNTKVEIKGKDVTVRGQNKDDVGQTAANMEQITRVRGKDIRVFQDRIYVVSKVRAV
ncbi:MAG TPA: 50S ribosomal protein L6 [Candidatus Diapherotrites archaeon]|uniref:50S ribosomal protein L6 n=1 Tax=Candidatus Iainarchaeum sp. TaxID=3101447 RepID=A0A7J4IXI1_9ARCH|nr:50S ribosomal protein L6P [uncultured archaeon]HIH10212.1 50S ribosomal protein L6 [Candidatus Diapherotrites archaeon]